jgi:hypothetical protein
MFSFKTKKLKKKKKISHKLLFITGNKRVILSINFLKYLILLNTKKKKKNMNIHYFSPLTNFIASDKNNNVTKIKYQIYKKKLAKMQD